MKYHIRKGPEYPPSNRAFSLNEIEQRIRSGDYDGTFQLRAEGESDWRRVSEFTDVAVDVAVAHAEVPSRGSAHSFAVVERYREGYRVSSAAIGLGIFIKSISWVLGGIGLFVCLTAAASQFRGGGVVAIYGAVVGFFYVVVCYFLAVLVSAVGQILRSTLDSAVHTSPFLNERQKSQAMGLEPNDGDA